MTTRIGSAPQGTRRSPLGGRIEQLSGVRQTVVMVVFGILAGYSGLILGGYELRWIVYALGSAVFMAILAVIPKRERLLTTLFLISLQIDVYVRFLYGRAGTPGLEVPLSALMGLLFWGQLRLMTRGAAAEFNWFGVLRRPILALLATTIISLVFTSERFAGVARLLFELELLLVYALAFNLVRRNDGVAGALKVLAFTLGAQATICIIQSRLGINFSLLGEVSNLDGIPRPGGTVSTNPAGFASFIMPLIMIFTARFVSRDRTHRNRIDGVLVILGIVAIVLTYTRAAWAGLALGLAYITVVGFRQRHITLKQIAVIAAVALVVLAAAAPLMQQRLTEEPLGESYDERARLNQIAIGIISQHPLFGVGPGAYNYLFKEYMTSDWQDEFWAAGVHNEYLMRTAETGLPGGIAFVWFLAAAFAQSRRLSRSNNRTTRIFGLGWSAGLLALAWQMYWVPWRGFSYNSMLWLLVGLAEGLELRERPPDEIPDPRARAREA
jgi:putative inorganic carbon (HCO3(-)) transporter